MALKYFNGFESGDLTETFGANGTVSIQGTTKRTGGYALKCVSTTTAQAYCAMPVGYDEYGALAVTSTAPNYHSFYFSVAVLPAANNEEIATFSSVSTGLNLRIKSDGILALYSSTTLVATGSNALSINTWYRIDVKITSGGWEVKLNGTSEISGATSYTTSNRLNLGKHTDRNGQSIEYYYDDYFLDGAAYTAADAVGQLLANANGTYTAFTNDYTYVDETPHDSATTVVESTGTGQKESVNLQSLSDGGISGTIVAVLAHTVCARALGSFGTITTNIFVKSGATELATTDDATLAAGYAVRAKIYNTDPNTSAAWTSSAVDALEVGANHVSRSSDRIMRVTSMRATVAYTYSAPAATFIPQIIHM